MQGNTLLFMGSRVLPAVCFLSTAHLFYVNWSSPLSAEEKRMLQELRNKKRPSYQPLDRGDGSGSFSQVLRSVVTKESSEPSKHELSKSIPVASKPLDSER